jgi:dihydroorotate dehydrogenase (fumarate)/dihydroorotate dehydrogenase
VPANLYRSLIRPLLFRMDPERAHALTIEACRVAGRLPLVPALIERSLACSAPELACEVAGLSFEHPIGLAAGWDKSGRALRMFDALGFGFAEIGSVSADASIGNPKPRLFRLPQDEAIVVNYGLPNDGAAAVARRIDRYRPRSPLGINLVNTNRGADAPPADEATILDDFERSAALLHARADYLTLNLSCPNAVGGKDLFGERGPLTRLLERLQAIKFACPVFLKLPPVADDATLDRLLEEVDAFPFVRGFGFNLPSGKPADLKLATPERVWKAWPGAVAGRPVAARIDDCVRRLYRRMPRGRYALNAAGGDFTGEDAYRKIRLGASLVQIYTALVYEGPGVTRRIAGELASLLRRDGVANVHEAVGIDAGASDAAASFAFERTVS